MAHEILDPVRDLHQIARSWTGDRRTAIMTFGTEQAPCLLAGEEISAHQRLAVASAAGRIESFCLSHRAGTSQIMLRLFLHERISSLALVIGGYSVPLFDAGQDFETIVHEDKIARLEDGFRRVKALADGSPPQVWTIPYNVFDRAMVRASGREQARAWVALRLLGTGRERCWEDAMRAVQDANHDETAT